jgi:hypothetical protein
VKTTYLCIKGYVSPLCRSIFDLWRMRDPSKNKLSLMLNVSVDMEAHNLKGSDCASPLKFHGEQRTQECYKRASIIIQQHCHRGEKRFCRTGRLPYFNTYGENVTRNHGKWSPLFDDRETWLIVWLHFTSDNDNRSSELRFPVACKLREALWLECISK